MYFINIDYDKCDGCGKCIVICPRGIIKSKSDDSNIPVLPSTNRCKGCMSCYEICPLGCIEIREL